MADQSSHDVVNQTLSGGEPSPSDVPASINDKTPAGGDVGETKNTSVTTQPENKASVQQSPQQTSDFDPSLERNDMGKDTENSPTVSPIMLEAAASPLNQVQDISKQGPGPVETRALEMNGLASASDGGEDTASLGGSESDASRTEGRRPGSKRPTAFKPVTFAKFSVPKAPGTSATTKISEKAPSSSTTPLGMLSQSSRPRLVAKTTSSLRDGLSKTGINAGKQGGAGPDPNQVWNKNRPAQPTPAKHLTDEELKQQYGIHMTSRIQEDGGGTESKWADIDDDEDDWAPETIEWTDGTKTSLTQNIETAPTPAQDDKALAEAKIEFPPPEQASIPKEPPKFVSKPTTSIGPNPTVLRLGASAERQAKSASILSKGPNDKSPASTSPAPPPAKSPWAPLPPFEKVSPIMPPVLQVQPSPRASNREPYVSDGFGGVVPPKEIAADDFNRSWKEGQSGATRELFNSRSGRYEPVSETRKGPWRSEQSFRTPAVLQRPAPGEQVGPAEPSPAFQTHRSSGQDGTWTRRRTSSNVSGGSGSFARRMSIGRPDVAQRSFEPRRGSQVNGMIEPSMPNRDMPPSKERPALEVSPSQYAPDSAWPPRSHETAANAPSGTDVPHAPDEQAAATQIPQEDPVAMQERIMKEKRLEARQRRIEQEEKEEAAKRERIRQKLEALGPAPEKSKSKRKESLESTKAEANTLAAPASQSPPKPPVPEPTGEPKQYGMMKVHHPDNVKKLVAGHERERVAEKSLMANARRVSSPAREPKPDTAAANGFQQLADSQTHAPDKLSEPKVDEQNPQWKSGINVSTSYTPWSSNAKLVGASSSIANPWKPLSNDKTLGNGIFEQSLGGFPPRDISLRGHLGLEQPSMAAGPQPFSAPSHSPQENASMSPLPSPKTRHAPYDPMNHITRPGPIGPPSLQHSHWQQDSRVNGTAAWNNFHSVAAKREAEENEKVHNEMTGIRDGQSLKVSFNETWRQVRTGDQAGQRQVVGISRSTENGASISNLPGFDHPVSTLPFADATTRPLVSVPARSSRFFPQATTEPPKKLPAEEEDYIRSPSPPPPEELSNHPVYTGDSNRPLVHLPAPKPIVKLPPKVVAPLLLPPPPTFASMVASPHRVAPQPVSTATSWQEKINCLFGKKTVPPEKKNALAVTSASKEPLDVQLHIAAVSVSLPQYVEDESQVGDGEMTAKQVEEAEEIFEDREVGSLPVVRVPNNAPPAAWHAAPAPSQSRLRSKNLKPMQVHSIEPYSFGFNDKNSSGNIRVSIRFPGAILAKTITLQKRTGSISSKPQRGPSTYKLRKSTKPREGSGSSSSKKATSSQQTGGSSSSPRRQSRNASWGPRTFSGSR